MTEPYVQVRARVRFMIYGNQPAPFGEVEMWTLRVPPAWIAGVAPGASAPQLTQRCGNIVAQQYASDRDAAVKRAQQSLDAGGEYDAGHYVLEGASVWLLHPDELRRRPWIGRKRFFRVVSPDGSLRAGGEADAPRLAPLSPFEEQAFAGWRADEVEDWSSAAKAYAAALALADDACDRGVLAEAAAGVVRANAKMQRYDDAAAAARDAIALTQGRGLPGDAVAMIHIRLAEGWLQAERPADAVSSFAAASALLPRDHRDAAWLASSYGLALIRAQDYGAAIRELEVAAAAHERSGSGDVQTRASTLFNLGLALEHEDRPADAEPRLRAALALREQQGDAGVGPAIETRLALARVLARKRPGAIAEARELLARVRGLLRPASTGDGLVHWATALIEHAESGDTVRTLASFDRALPLIQDRSYATWIAADRARFARS